MTMREGMGLFRGKRVDKLAPGHWVFGCLMTMADGGIGILRDEKRNGESVTGFPVDPDTVGEFTGRSFSGRKAFEGDIFHVPDEERDIEIVWDEYMLAFMGVGTQDHEDTWLNEYSDNDLFWIGTKWDKPELLEAAP